MIFYEYYEYAGCIFFMTERYLNASHDKSNLKSSAYVVYRPNGLKHVEEWRVDGKMHRVDGPALTTLWMNGEKYTEFYLQGSGFTFEYWIEIVKGLISPEQEKTLREKYE